jgi:hypothetical protein
MARGDSVAKLLSNSLRDAMILSIEEIKQPMRVPCLEKRSRKAGEGQVAKKIDRCTAHFRCGMLKVTFVEEGQDRL